MFGERYNYDTLDIMAACLGGVLAFALVPFEMNWATERLVVPGAAFACILMKRRLVPTMPPRRDSSRLARLIYLWVAIVGTALAGGGMALAMFDVPEFEQPVAGLPEGWLMMSLLASGGVLLGIATAMDRAWLKGSSDDAHR